MKKTPRKTPRRPDQRGQRNDTAAHCHAKAQALVQAAINTPMGIERSLLERSAAAWSMRAEQLSRAEMRLVAKLPEPGSAAEEANMKDDVRNWENEGGHMSCTSGRIITVIGGAAV